MHIVNTRWKYGPGRTDVPNVVSLIGNKESGFVTEAINSIIGSSEIKELDTDNWFCIL